MCTTLTVDLNGAVCPPVVLVKIRFYHKCSPLKKLEAFKKSVG